jgi:pantetheine-phosphate adenylyltransferase
MKIGVYPGSFDPTTNGHMDIIERASKLVDKLIVGVLHNPDKKPYLSLNKRVELLRQLTSMYDNISVEPFSGLLVDFVAEQQASIIIRGFRAISDFEYELQLAQTNYMLNETIETVFLVSRTEYAYISSSMVKQLLQFGGSISKMVPKLSEIAVMNEKHIEHEEGK